MRKANWADGAKICHRVSLDYPTKRIGVQESHGRHPAGSAASRRTTRLAAAPTCSRGIKGPGPGSDHSVDAGLRPEGPARYMPSRIAVILLAVASASSST